MLCKNALVALSILSPLALANPDPRPPGPAPPLDYAKLGSLDLTPKEVLDADAAAVNAVVNQVLGPDYPRPARPDLANSNQGNILIPGLNAVFGDGSLDGDAVFAPVFGGSPAKLTLPALTCDALPPLFSIYGVLSTYAPMPYVGISTFTGTLNAASSISATGAGYGFLAPANLTNPKTFAMSGTSLGAPYGGESAVWSLNCQTRELKATWTQADGSQLPLTFVTWSPDGLVATGNYDAFKARFPTASAPLTFTYNPLNASAAFYPATVPIKLADVPPIVIAPGPSPLPSSVIDAVIKAPATTSKRGPRTPVVSPIVKTVQTQPPPPVLIVETPPTTVNTRGPRTPKEQAAVQTPVLAKVVRKRDVEAHRRYKH